MSRLASAPESRAIATFIWLVISAGTAMGQASNGVDSLSAADPRQIPQGDAAEILAYLEELVQSTPPQGVDERTHACQTCAALVRAAEQILDDGKATPAQIKAAINFKVEGLSVLDVLGDADAHDKLYRFLTEVAGDDEGEIAQFARQQLVDLQLGRLRRGGLSDAQLDVTVEEIVRWLLTGEMDRARLRRLVEMVGLLESLGRNAAATAAIESILPRVQESNEPRVVDSYEILLGIRRRLELPGKELELSGTLLNGETLDWQSYRGKVVLVDFWATWCSFCLEEIPNIKEQYTEFHGKGFEVIGVCLDEQRESAQQTKDRIEMPWPTLFSDDPDATGWDHPLAVKYGISQLPMAILVDQQGRVVHMDARGERLGEELARLFGGAAAPHRTASTQFIRAQPAPSKEPAGIVP